MPETWVEKDPRGTMTPASIAQRPNRASPRAGAPLGSGLPLGRVLRPLGARHGSLGENPVLSPRHHRTLWKAWTGELLFGRIEEANTLTVSAVSSLLPPNNQPGLGGLISGFFIHS